MKIVNQSYEIIDWHPMDDFWRIVKAARICYQSQPLNDLEMESKFLQRLIDRDECSPLEHSSLSVIFITNRGVTHELVRHRLAAYSQESTRYCKYRNEVTFIDNPSIKPGDRFDWMDTLLDIETIYIEMLESGYSPQEARAILPNDLKTQIMMTANLREWRHVFELRCSPNAHPHIRELMLPLLADVNNQIPVIFADIAEKYGVANAEH